MSTLEVNDSKKSMAKGFVILSIAGLLVKVISVLYNPILKIIIGDEALGIYLVAYQVFTYIYIIANSGIPIAISRGVAEQVALGHGKDAHRYFQLSRLLLGFVGIVGSVFMFLFSDYLAMLMDKPQISLALKYISPTIFFSTLLSAYRGYFQGREIMSPTGVSQVFEQIANTIFSLGCAYILINSSMEKGIAGATVGTSIGALVAVLIVKLYYGKNKYDRVIIKNKRQLTDKQLIKKIATYAMPITVCACIQQSGLIIDPIVIDNGLTSMQGFTSEMASKYYGYYGLYNQLIFVPITIITALCAAVIPAVTNAVARRDRKEAVSKIKYAYKLCFMVAIPSAVGLGVLSGPICNILDYDIITSKLLNYGTIVLVFMAIMQIQTSVLQGLGKLYHVTAIAVIGLIAKVLVNRYLIPIPHINIFGAIIGNLIGFLVIVFLNSILIRKSIKKRINMVAIGFPSFIASVIMGGAVIGTYIVMSLVLGKSWIGNFICTMISIGIGVLVYGLVMMISGGITKADLNMFPISIRRRIPKSLLNKMK